ncbi:LRR domain containing protein [Parasponia andersonii]|uniref:LRR domain containing protein n=1 Tax=Parasponia andersonii TaxID=3476 RepID=A0A2P5DM92_PARAD|nr:LRR domain containing protein [Parasponia andersonii]
MEAFPLNPYPRLEDLHLYDCNSMKSLPLDYFPRLKGLWLENCQNLESLTFPPEIESFGPEGGVGLASKLEKLTIWGCNKLVAQHGHWDLKGLTSLKTLRMQSCDVVLDSFPALSFPVSLTSFVLIQTSVLFLNNGTEKRKGRTGIRSPTFRYYVLGVDKAEVLSYDSYNFSIYCLDKRLDFICGLSKILLCVRSYHNKNKADRSSNEKNDTPGKPRYQTSRKVTLQCQRQLSGSFGAIVPKMTLRHHLLHLGSIINDQDQEDGEEEEDEYMHTYSIS